MTESWPLDIGTLLGMPLEIPTRRVAGTREQRVHAGLGLRRIKQEFRLAVFLLDRIIVSHCDLAVCFISRYSVAEDTVVGYVGDRDRPGCRQDCVARQSLQEMPDFRAQHRRHRLQL